LKYPWWWAHEGPKHVGKRREKGNKDIVQKVASVGSCYRNINKGVLTEWFYIKLLQHIRMSNYKKKSHTISL